MKQPWVHSAGLDSTFILAPAFLVTAVVLALGDSVRAIAETPPLLWLLLIVGVDVGHVWSTLFRTYLDRGELRARQALYVLTPLLGFVLGVVLYRLGDMVFWRTLAYLAVFHFVRQQYGFMMIYRRAEQADPAWARRLDQVLIYAATLYPLIAWHCQPRQFDWFVPGDFLAFDMPIVAVVTGWAYLAMFAAYVVKEVVFALRRGGFNLPKNLMLLGTALSWYVGILVFNNDLAFTATNVIAHGVPYMALIWIYGRNQEAHDQRRTDYLLPVARLFQPKLVPIYLGVLFIIAYLEEGLWDGLVWRENSMLFPAFAHLPGLENPAILTWLVPLLALPQITHYLLDAYIWRLGVANTPWKTILFLNSTKT